MKDATTFILARDWKEVISMDGKIFIPRAGTTLIIAEKGESIWATCTCNKERFHVHRKEAHDFDLCLDKAPRPCDPAMKFHEMPDWGNDDDLLHRSAPVSFPEALGHTPRPHVL